MLFASITRSLARRVIPLALGLTVLSGTHASAEAPPPAPNGLPALVFGVVPQQSPSRLARIWAPLMEEVGQVLGRSVRFATAASIDQFEIRLQRGDYDVAYMNPFHYVSYRETPGRASPGYVAIARVGAHELHGIVVVAQGNSAATLSDLAGTEIAFPAPKAFAATLLTRADLVRAGVRHTPRYVNSHDSVYRAVAGGLIDAGGGVPRTLARMPEDIRSRLRVLHRTADHVPHAFAVQARVAEADRREIQDALAGLGETDSGRAALRELGFKPIVPALDSDWDGVGALFAETGVVAR